MYTSIYFRHFLCSICAESCYPPMPQNKAVVFCVMDRRDIQNRAEQTTKVGDGASPCFDFYHHEAQCYRKKGKLKYQNIGDQR